MPMSRSLLASATVALLAGCTPRSDPTPPSPATNAVARLAEACVDVGVKGCVTTGGGYFNAAGRRTFYWQLQEGETPDDVAGGAYVLLATDPDRGLEILASGAESHHAYEAPELVWIDATPYVAIAGVMAGTGRFNADALYRWTTDPSRPLAKLDNQGWREALGRLLPGFGVRKGVRFDYGETTITALTALWRDTDPECCPIGGEARLSFAIEGDRLVLGSVDRLPPQA